MILENEYINEIELYENDMELIYNTLNISKISFGIYDSSGNVFYNYFGGNLDGIR